MAIDDQYQIHLQKLTNKEQPVTETIYALGNGHMGVRASNPLQGNSDHYEGNPGLFVNGFYDLSPITYGERYFGYPRNNQTIAQLPDPRFLILEIDGVRSDQTPFRVETIDKNLDMETGLLVETFRITTPKQKMLTLTLQSFMSQSDYHLYVVRYEIRALNFSGKVTLLKQHNYVNQSIPNSNEDVRRAQRHNPLGQVYMPADSPTMLIETQKSQLGILMMFHYLGSDPRMKMVSRNNIPCYEVQLDLTPGKLEQFAFGYSLGNIHALMTVEMGPDFYIKKTLERFHEQNFAKLFEASANHMRHFWQDSDIVIDGDPTLQRGIRFNLFHLYQAAGRDSVTDVPAKGVTGPGYEGHYFWDTEMYMLPFFIYTQPEIAKALLTYRFSILDEARQHAREMGIENGVLYPWHTINGEEASAYYPAGTAQVHINADIAYATDLYIQVTQDMDFLENYGFEMIVSTARFWLAFGNYGEQGKQKNKFVINAVTGPDEYTALVDNNYYTNRMAQNNLFIAVKYAKQLQKENPTKLADLGVNEEEIVAFQTAANKMYLPYDDDLQIKMQDDSSPNRPVFDIANEPRENFPLLLHYHPLVLYRYRVNKQADTLMSDFLFPFDQDEPQLQRDYDYYEKITTHDSSLSRAIFSVLANRIHNPEKAYNYFMDTALMDLTDLQGNSADGIHAANMGGTWLSLIYGFAGMHAGINGLTFDPQFPSEWLFLSFKVKYHKRQIKVAIQRQEVTFTLLVGKPINIFYREQEVELVNSTPVIIHLTGLQV
ncbi:family 65 glycosyl hydrolase [Loigolactobacillus backii]|uniref:glycoside hydrolase family 65 protein n=1 Tax=Loigolactobacillus backii TaxID=375175 RepID=UPI000C1C84C7|nr:glycosyl hydrolase family 65 protein [Loigolactobacillus backii]PIO82300.1 family 65 glycosyl hydrolase [Loigolactobacillus backii]